SELRGAQLIIRIQESEDGIEPIASEEGAANLVEEGFSGVLFLRSDSVEELPAFLLSFKMALVEETGEDGHDRGVREIIACPFETRLDLVHASRVFGAEKPEDLELKRAKFKGSWCHFF